jgi:RimJ/RimL family protein N-acetyltransferase
MGNAEKNLLSVREIHESDIEPLCNYWHNASENYLLSMGVDIKKLPSRESFSLMLREQINTPIEQKKSYCIIWQYNGKPVGHSNTNPTRFGEEATMHLHLWESNIRKKGMGTEFLKMTLRLFFENLQLKKLYCEPYALNPAPNKALEKAGFNFIKKYVTTPGFINFEQPVNRWEMSRADYLSLFQ